MPIDSTLVVAGLLGPAWSTDPDRLSLQMQSLASFASYFRDSLLILVMDEGVPAPSLPLLLQNTSEGKRGFNEARFLFGSTQLSQELPVEEKASERAERTAAQPGANTALRQASASNAALRCPDPSKIQTLSRRGREPRLSRLRQLYLDEHHQACPSAMSTSHSYPSQGKRGQDGVELNSPQSEEEQRETPNRKDIDVLLVTDLDLSSFSVSGALTSYQHVRGGRLQVACAHGIKDASLPSRLWLRWWRGHEGASLWGHMGLLRDTYATVFSNGDWPRVDRSYGSLLPGMSSVYAQDKLMGEKGYRGEGGGVVEVDSCFGGAALYDSALLCRFSVTDGGSRQGQQQAKSMPKPGQRGYSRGFRDRAGSVTLKSGATGPGKGLPEELFRTGKEEVEGVTTAQLPPHARSSSVEDRAWACAYSGSGIDYSTEGLSWAAERWPEQYGKFHSGCGQTLCEHIPFHFCLRASGAKIGIVQDFVVKPSLGS